MTVSDRNREGATPSRGDGSRNPRPDPSVADESLQRERDEPRARAREALRKVGLDPARYEIVTELPLSGAAVDGFGGESVDLGPQAALLIRRDGADDVDNEGAPRPNGNGQRPDPPELLTGATVLLVGFPDCAPPLIWAIA